MQKLKRNILRVYFKKLKILSVILEFIQNINQTSLKDPQFCRQR